MKLISSGEVGPGSALFIRRLRVKLKRQLPRPPQPQRRQVRPEAAPWIAGEPERDLREMEIDRAAARAFARSPAAQRASPALQPPAAARISRRT